MENLLSNLIFKPSKSTLDEQDRLGMVRQFIKKVGQRVVRHSLPLSTNTITTGMVSPIQAGSTASVKHQAVLSGIDTLVLTAGGATEPSVWFKEQHLVWEEYCSSYEYGEEFICVDIGGSWFQLYPYGNHPYKYQLHNPEIGFIKLWNPDKWSSSIPSKQSIYLQLTSKYIHSNSITDLEELVKSICSHFVENVEVLQLLISRVDLHSDITNGSKMLSYAEIENSITRCKVKNIYFDTKEVEIEDTELEDLRSLVQSPCYYNKGGQKLIPEDLLKKLVQLAEKQTINGASNIISKNELETAYFGKVGSNIWGKVYDKTKQIQYKNDTDTPLLWLENGWNQEDKVVRVEFSMRRSFLKELDNGIYISLQSFVSNIDKVWKYLTENWLRLVEVKNTNNSTWSKLSKFWLKVQSSFNTTVETIIRKKNYQGKVNQLWRQGIGCIKQMISIGMISNEDIMFLKSTKQAIDITLSSSLTSGEYYKRRQFLGVA